MCSVQGAACRVQCAVGMVQLALCRVSCAEYIHLSDFLRTHNMPDNYVKVLTALGMHSNKLKLPGRLTVEVELPEL